LTDFVLNLSNEEKLQNRHTVQIQDNLFRLNTLLLRLHVQNVSINNITQIRSDWDWEAAKGPLRSSSQAYVLLLGSILFLSLIKGWKIKNPKVTIGKFFSCLFKLL